MTNEKPTRPPIDEAQSEGPVVPQQSWFREMRPAFCSNCGTEVASRAHFCPSCQSFLATPMLGRLASAKRRLGAAFLDGLFKEGGLFGSIFWATVFPGSGARIVAIMSTVYWISALFLWSRGTTPAKRLLGMTVITEDGEPAGFFRMAFRETIGKGISSIVFGLGLIAIPFDREKQGWHDKMFDTWVVLEDED